MRSPVDAFYPPHNSLAVQLPNADSGGTKGHARPELMLGTILSSTKTEGASDLRPMLPALYPPPGTLPTCTTPQTSCRLGLALGSRPGWLPWVIHWRHPASRTEP